MLRWLITGRRLPSARASAQEHRDSEIRASDNFFYVFSRLHGAAVGRLSPIDDSICFSMLCSRDLLFWASVCCDVRALLVLATFARLHELPCKIPLKRFALSLFFCFFFLGFNTFGWASNLVRDACRFLEIAKLFKRIFYRD